MAVPVTMKVAMTVPMAMTMHTVLMGHPIRSRTRIARLTFLMRFLRFKGNATIRSTHASSVSHRINRPISSRYVNGRANQCIIRSSVVVPLARLNSRDLRPISRRRFDQIEQGEANVSSVRLITRLILPSSLVSVISATKRVVNSALIQCVSVQARHPLTSVRISRGSLLIHGNRARHRIRKSRHLTNSQVRQNRRRRLRLLVLRPRRIRVNARSARHLQGQITTILVRRRLTLILLITRQSLTRRQRKRCPFRVLPQTRLHITSYRRPRSAYQCHASRRSKDRRSRRQLQDRQNVTSHHQISSANITFHRPLHRLILLTLIRRMRVRFLFSLLTAFRQGSLFLLNQRDQSATTHLFLLHPSVLSLSIRTSSRIVRQASSNLFRHSRQVIRILRCQILAATIASRLITFRRRLIRLPSLQLSIRVQCTHIHQSRIQALTKIHRMILSMFHRARLILRARSLLTMLTKDLRMRTHLKQSVHRLIFPLMQLSVQVRVPRFFLSRSRAIISRIKDIRRSLILIISHVHIMSKSRHISRVLHAQSKSVLRHRISSHQYLIHRDDLRTSLRTRHRVLRQQFHRLRSHVRVLITMVGQQSRRRPTSEHHSHIIRHRLRQLTIHRLLPTRNRSKRCRLLSKSEGHLRQGDLYLFHVQRERLCK